MGLGGRDSCYGRQDLITFQLPGDALSGCPVPIMFRWERAVPGNTATIAISSGARLPGMRHFCPAPRV